MGKHQYMERRLYARVLKGWQSVAVIGVSPELGRIDGKKLTNVNM